MDKRSVQKHDLIAGIKIELILVFFFVKGKILIICIVVQLHVCLLISLSPVNLSSFHSNDNDIIQLSFSSRDPQQERSINIQNGEYINSLWFTVLWKFSVIIHRAYDTLTSDLAKFLKDINSCCPSQNCLCF